MFLQGGAVGSSKYFIPRYQNSFRTSNVQDDEFLGYPSLSQKNSTEVC